METRPLPAPLARPDVPPLPLVVPQVFFLNMVITLRESLIQMAGMCGSLLMCASKEPTCVVTVQENPVHLEETHARRHAPTHPPTHTHTRGPPGLHDLSSYAGASGDRWGP